MTNELLAQHLIDHAARLEVDGASLFRARAHRAAAFTIARMDRSLADIFSSEGRPGLEALPGIGKSLAYTLEGLLTTGEFRTLREPGAHQSPRSDLLGVPGVGPRLAERLRDRLGVTTIASLREAVHSGQLTDLKVTGKRRAGIEAALAYRQGQETRPEVPANEPDVPTLLAVDAAFRDGENVEGRDGWRLRVGFADTAIAHRMGATRDWVVVWFDKEGMRGQRTIVTRDGIRVVRGREHEPRQAGKEPVSSSVVLRAS